MSCSRTWIRKAKNRKLLIQIEPKAGSNPDFIDLAMRIIDRSDAQGPTKTKNFSATQLKTGVSQKLVRAKRYDLLLTTDPVGTELVVNLGLDDGGKLASGVVCTRDQNPITGDWAITTFR